jgi:hypothetical protein
MTLVCPDSYQSPLLARDCHNESAMETETPTREDPTLTSVRRRSVGYLGYLFWVLVVLCLLWMANMLGALVERWVAMLHGVRRAAGFVPPAAGPDYWILTGVAVLIVIAVIALAAAYSAYRSAWNRRLAATWGGPVPARFLRLRRLRALATPSELRARPGYLTALASSPEWARTPLPAVPSDSYKAAAEQMLRTIEPDIAHRAVTAGLIIGLNRNAILDSLTIAAAAFELQLHVLTRLGKRPTLRVWIELLKRTGASLFLNSYVSRDDALYLNLAIRKAALGLEFASDSIDHAASAMADVDWDEVLGGVSVPGLSAVTSFATMSMSIGAFGLRQLGSFIEATANDLLQGVLAGGILYYHGMALAAECLALDEEHRRSPEMTRTIGQAMAIACTPAGRLLRDQVRRMREFLRERRRIAILAAKDAAKEGVGRLRTASTSKWDNIRDVFRREPGAPVERTPNP